jgi:CHAD domain-containing protein
MERERIVKPLRQLSKLLKEMAESPTPGEVHKLRTRARQIEALAAALEPADAKQTRRLLKAIKPVRKAAGGVRDMDVLAGDLRHMPVTRANNGTRDSVVRLVEHLSTVRRKNAADLLDAVDRQRKPARRELRRYTKLVDSVARGKRTAQIDVAYALKSEDGDDSRSSALMDELAQWPRLNARNIHLFRLKVKELRYVLELFPQADEKFVELLGKVKDEIGDWHDWQQLGEIAREVLDAQEDRELLEQIDAVAKQKLARALAGANGLRQRYLHVTAQRRAS